MSALPKRTFTADEYLLLENQASYKSQFVPGKSTPWLARSLGTSKLWITSALLLRRSSATDPASPTPPTCECKPRPATCGPIPTWLRFAESPRFDRSSRPSVLLNPQVIFEVLSPSTETFDRGEKFFRYRTLDSLTDYVLAASESMRVEHFVRQENGAWTMTEYRQPGDALPLRTLAVTLTLAQIYRQVVFPDDRPPA